MKIENKLTEDETVILLIERLKLDGWKVDKFCLGQTKGNDIEATKNRQNLIIEVKGAKAGDNSPTKRRDFFDSNQIKTHFGKAIVKVLSEMTKNPENNYAIAHPNDELIKKSIGNLIPFLEKLDIKHFWVEKYDKV